ncbi:MAG: hypothetical protein LCI02_07925 [Proteobacteria bacterium]|nr:hypothetical protein [Pseudomonadota bacterium]
MASKVVVDPPCLETFNARPNDEARNRLLLQWLEDDDHRAGLFAMINDECNGRLGFPSRAGPPEPCCPDDEHPRPPPAIGHKTVYLVTQRAQIEAALADGGPNYSSRVYGELGGGNFLLALDPSSGGDAAHAAQVRALRHSFPRSDDLVATVAHHACQAAAILSLRSQKFDLAAFAEQSALRFCQYLFGYAQTDFRLLEASLRASYRALVYQVLGRHFATDPLAIPQAKQAMGQLLARTAALIDAHAIGDEDALKGCRPPGALAGLQPVLKALGQYNDPLNGEQRAVVAVGAAVGTVGNVQAAVCIAIKAFFAVPAARKKASALALAENGGRPSARRPEWQALIGDALGRNPPIAFLPRVQISTNDDGKRQFDDLLLALGGATRAPRAPAFEDPLIWGLPGQGRHPCLGHGLAWPLIVEVVRHVMGLPGLEEELDPLDATPIGLKKRWGFACERYPFTYRRDQRLAQSTLNVAMRIRQPVKDHAARLREVIRSGAPRIQEALRESRHLHFAWFEFIERDTVLVLHTVYDGDFAAYIQHFALRVGDLFDSLFESIEDAPPTPVDKFPNEFIALIQRYNRAPAMGYFFSAYPRSETAEVVRNEAAALKRREEARAADAAQRRGAQP